MIGEMSPFTLARFEYEQEHLYFLQKRLFSRLEYQKPVYLVGSRGTGKTTLLKAMSWSERLTNKSLARQVRGRASKYIGVYLKLPEIQLGHISRWAESAGEHVHANIFAHYLDLVWLEELLTALSELTVVGKIDLISSDERLCVGGIYDELLGTLESRRSIPKTFRELASTLKRRREDLEICASTGVRPALAVERLRLVSHIGSFGREVCQRLEAALNRAGSGAAKQKPWIFKVCMDEGECLDPFQLRVLNTMLRLSKAPLFFVASFVSRPTDTSETLIANLTLQQADRELVFLDDITEDEYRELVDGVSTVRIQHITRDEGVAFDVYCSLGSLDINGLLLSILKESVSPLAKSILSDAEAVKSSPSNRRKGQAEASSAPPIYQTYLINALKIDSEALNTNIPWRKRKQESAEIRKKIVAAYLSICHDVGVEPRYSSADVVLQASDKCVRDFLSELDEIFLASELSVSKFLSAKVDPDIQDRGVKEASKKKYQSLPQLGVNSPVETAALVEGLSRLTAKLQSSSESRRHLRSTERGVFVIEVPKEEIGDAEVLIRSIREAAEAGFLRLLVNGENQLQVRVHTSLAAHFGFSYRGAYYPVRIDWRALNQLRKLREPSQIKEMIGQMYAFAERNEIQGDMFSG